MALHFAHSNAENILGPVLSLSMRGPVEQRTRDAANASTNGRVEVGEVPFEASEFVTRQ